MEDNRFISARDLSLRTGMRLNLIKRLAKGGQLPKPVDRIGTGNPIFELNDPKMVAFLKLVETPAESEFDDPRIVLG